jgi:hypothetical protein
MAHRLPERIETDLLDQRCAGTTRHDDGVKQSLWTCGCFAVITSCVACGPGMTATGPPSASVPDQNTTTCAALVGQVVLGERQAKQCSGDDYSGGSAPCYPHTGVQEGSFFWFIDPENSRKMIFGRAGGKWRLAPSTITTSQMAAAIGC